jgi:5-methylcytosine-specific restriction enzyme subunit McrC
MTQAEGRAQDSNPKRVLIRLTEWDRTGPNSDEQGVLLRGLSLDSSARTRALVSDLARRGVVTITESRAGLTLETGSYVGRVAVGPLDIVIVPKIAWSRWLTLIAFALRLRGLVRTERMAMQIDSYSLQDLIILQLVGESRDLIARGLHREYVRRNESLGAPRGRIDFGHLATRGGLREAAIPCQFTRRDDNSALNRALLAGLRSAANLARDIGLRADARQLAHELESTISAGELSEELLRAAQRSLDRRTTRYEAALRLIELLLAGQSIALERNDTSQDVTLPGFALDMNRLWQRIIARVIGEWQDDSVIREEFALRGVFRRSPESPRARAVPRLRPDFAAFINGRLTMFVDAKYRDLWERPLPPEMLYQLSIYAMSQSGRTAAMLYPTHDELALEERINIEDPVTESRRATVALRPVSLRTLEELISASPSARRQAQRRVLAMSLIRS